LLTLSPLVIPSVVSGIAVYFMLVKIGVAGRILGLIIGHTILALPYAIVITSASLQGIDKTLEQAAMSLGATRVRAFMTITLPLIRAGVIVSAFLAFMRSFDELVYALFLGMGQVSTLPLKMWDGVKQDVSPIISAVASIQILLVILGLILVEFRRRQTGRLV
jgi:ABC-type spermidine/putrescine transport system permease subunit II